jgi:hypothetical protein
MADAGVTKTESAATNFLKASDPMRIRYAYQVTVAALGILMKRAHQSSGIDMNVHGGADAASPEARQCSSGILTRNMK